MDPFIPLEYALFQLTPTRTRCDLLLCYGKNKEKLASGLVEPFISHLKLFKDQISKGGYSITLRPPTTNAFWFTKSTFQRLVRFINSPEVLERFIRLEREISQIENSNNESEEQAGEVGSLSSDGSTKKSTEPSKIKPGEAGDNAQEENSKVQLQRLLETRKAMLRKEQAMAYHRALVAGFETENMNDLILFADHFGASRLREACIEFRDLCKKKHNDGLWMDELAAMAAYPPSELAYTGTSGILIATESNASTLNNELNFEQEGEKNNTDQVPSTPSNVPMQMPWPNQMPQYMYNFPGPQGPRYPYPYPGMPPYYPAHMNWPPNADDGYGRHHRSSSKKKSKSLLPDSSEEEDEDSNEEGESDSVSDSGTVSKHEKSTKKNKKKSSKTVVIRNINYITSNRKNSDGSDDSAEDEVDGVLESLVKHHSKSSKSHEKKKKDVDLDNTNSGKRNENWDAFQNLLLKDDDQDEHFANRNDAMDVGSESYVKNQPKARANDSFVVPDRNGFDESRKVSSHDFENGEAFRMKGRDSSDADLVVSHRVGGGTDGMTNVRDFGSESSMIRNKRDGDWFVVKSSGSPVEKSTFSDDYASMRGDVFSSETNKKNEPIDDSFMVQPQTTVPYDSEWRSTDVSIVESVNKPDPNESSQAAKSGFYEPDDLYLMVSRDSGVEPSVRSSWTPEIDYGTEAQFTKSEPKPAPVETKEQTEESPVKAKTKKVAKPRPLSRSLPTDKRLPFVSRSVVPKSKREQEDEIRKRVEELAAERQRRIAERTAASASGSAKKPVIQKGSSGTPKKATTKATGK
ncbi:hypothetical protein M8C21_022710 [Ambrosia artemisiifolia]|uniref:COP1-interacting protein 7 n=1 Tax=Ambrosia artemisiifolia TaxID=4212 RepID=A0AAD5C767_AMBAR|nr:hypothetical protein M8C21_022710 [Ambrosia artemisiifolia]